LGLELQKVKKLVSEYKYKLGQEVVTMDESWEPPRKTGHFIVEHRRFKNDANLQEYLVLDLITGQLRPEHVKNEAKK
jgi:hypothetical protein